MPFSLLVAYEIDFGVALCSITQFLVGGLIKRKQNGNDFEYALFGDELYVVNIGNDIFC